MEEIKVLLLKLFLLICGLIGVSFFSFFYIDNLPSESVSPVPICGTLMMAGCLYILFMFLLALVIAKIFMKHSLLGSFSLILAINVIIFVTIDIISIVIFQTDFLTFYLFFMLFFLTIITIIVGLIARLVMKDNFGLLAFLVGVIGFFLNLAVLNFIFSHF